MNQVQQVTDDAKQTFQVALPDGSSFQLGLWYVPQQIGWFFSLSYGTFQLACMRVSTNQNLLNQYSNLLPFGLGCFTTDGREALLQEDFAAGNAMLCVLDLADLAALEAFYNGD